MPRPLVVGNGRLLVNFDDNLNIRDIYYPHVGQENHVLGHKFRLGIWVDKKLYWIDHSWKKTLKYKEEATVTDVVLKNEHLKIELLINDTVHPLKDVFLRKIIVKNLASRDREVRLFFSHDFHIYETDIGDTALFDPYLKAVIHYKRNRYFLINGSVGEKGLFQFSLGTTEFGGAEGTWRDAEDGELSNNPIAQGSVDSTVSFRTVVEAEKESRVYYWIAAGRDYSAVKELNAFVLSNSCAGLIDETTFYHRKWVNRHSLDFGGLPPNLVLMFKRSLLILKTQVDEDGAIIAANDSDVLQYNRDHYSYLWPRDGAFVAYALDRAGFPEITKRFFKFCSGILAEDGYFFHKYNADGSLASSWHPYVDKDGNKQLPIQEDETALVLYSLWNHYELYKDREFASSLYEDFIKKAADFMVEYIDPELKLPLPSYDLWEERRGILTFTCSAVYAGLQAAHNFAKLEEDLESAERYRLVAEDIKEAMPKYLYDPKEGCFLRMINIGADGGVIKDATVDSSVSGVSELGVFPADDPRVVKTMKAIKSKLWCNTEVGGIARYENDQYHQVAGGSKNVPGNPWFICTLWLAEWIIAKALEREDLEEALDILEWVSDHALESGVLAEQLDPYTGKPLSVSPLTWSHSTYVLTVMNYLDKLNELSICPVCGAPALTPHEHADKNE